MEFYQIHQLHQLLLLSKEFIQYNLFACVFIIKFIIKYCWYIYILLYIERDDYRYSGSENEEDEPALAGEASSIVQAPGGDTLRRNFQQIQEGRTLTQEVNPQPPAAKEKPSSRAQRDIPEPGPPARPAIPHRLIGAFDGISLINYDN